MHALHDYQGVSTSACSRGASLSRTGRRVGQFTSHRTRLVTRVDAHNQGWETGCKLIGVGSSVPEKRLTNGDLERLVETNDEWIKTRTGIR